MLQKRVHNIAQEPQHSKASKEHKYDESVNYYLKNFYEKNEMGMPSPSHEFESHMEGEMGMEGERSVMEEVGEV